MSGSRGETRFLGCQRRVEVDCSASRPGKWSENSRESRTENKVNLIEAVWLLMLPKTYYGRTPSCHGDLA